MNACERYEEMISALLDGELSGEDEAALRAHMEACPSCRAMYEAFAAVGGAVRGQDVPATLHEGIMTKVRAAERAGKTQHTIIRLRPILAAAACFIVLIGTAVALNNTTGFARRNAKSAKADANMAAPMAPEMEYATAADESVPEAGLFTAGGSILESKAAATDSAEAPKEAGDVLMRPDAPMAAGAPESNGAGEPLSDAAEMPVSNFDTATFPSVNDAAKIVYYENADAVIAASDLIVRAVKLDEVQTEHPIDNGVSDRFTLSTVQITEVFQTSGTAAVAAGDVIEVRESQWTDAESKTVHHMEGYVKMEIGKQYLLCLSRGAGQDFYHPVGLLYGKIPLDPQEAPFLGAAIPEIAAIMEDLRQTYCP